MKRLLLILAMLTSTLGITLSVEARSSYYSFNPEIKQQQNIFKPYQAVSNRANRANNYHATDYSFNVAGQELLEKSKQWRSQETMFSALGYQFTN